MPVYTFKGKNKSGETVLGTVEALGSDQAIEVLRGREIVPIELSEHKDNFISQLLKKPMGAFGKASFDQVVIFTRQLATMVAAGLPVNQCLNILALQAKSGKFRDLLKDCLNAIESGSSLSEAFKRQSGVFSPMYISLLEAGEASGNLDKILVKLADDLDKKREFRGKVKGAMIYPIIILVAMVGVVSLMSFFVVPKISGMYESMNVELPLPTKVMIGMSKFMIQYWWLLILGTIGVIMALRFVKATRAGKYFFAKMSFKMPVFGKISMGGDLSEFTSTLGLLIAAGVPIIDSLNIVTGAVKNQIYKDAIANAAKEVKKGVPLSVPLSKEPFFPPVLPQMVAVGEETGKLDEILVKLSIYFQTEMDQSVKNLSTAMEPFILLVLGVMVGGMIISIIMPIYKLTASFS